MRKICFGLGCLLFTLALLGKENKAYCVSDKDFTAFKESVDQKFQQIHEKDLRVHLGVFGNANYEVAGPSNAFPSTNEFFLGQTDLYLTGQVGDHISFLAEQVIEFSGQDPSVDIERIWAGYSFSDSLQIRAGRDHTSVGYWNRTFHHGAHLQTTIERPFFLDFEDGGGVIPAHTIGVFASGGFNLGDSRLKYEINIGNGENIGLQGDGMGNVVGSVLNLNPKGDNNTDKCFVGRLVFKPESDGGLALGISATWNRFDVVPDADVAASPLVFSGLGQIILEGEVIYTGDNFEFLTEFYNFDDAVSGMPTQGSARNYGFYAQAGWQANQDWKPYARLETLTVDGTDPFFSLLNQHNKTICLVGLRYEVVPSVSSLKIEARSVNEDGNSSTEIATAWGFGF